MNASQTDKNREYNRYILWHDILEWENRFLIDEDVLTIGEHGEMCVNPLQVNERSAGGTAERALLPANHHFMPDDAAPKGFTAAELGLDAGRTKLDILTEHNRAEMTRALAECRKWEERLREAPLGKTQQDYFIYLEDVIDRYARWFKTRGLPSPAAAAKG